MFMPSGGLLVEIEAPDPSGQYFDHPSTFEELVGCDDLVRNQAAATKWLSWIRRRAQQTGREGVPPAALSGWWRAGQRHGAPIEPLVGHLRHPKFHCVGRKKDTLERMFSTAYIVLPFATELGLRSHSRRFLFDLGASIS
jgi:hypothetical protein